MKISHVLPCPLLLLLRKCFWTLFLVCLHAKHFPTQVEAQPFSQPWRELRRIRYALSLKVPTKLAFRVQRDQKGRPTLVGQLVDDREMGLQFQPLQLRLPNGKSKTLLTDKRGNFRLNTQGWPTQGTYAMAFPGNSHHASSHCKRQVDLGRVDLLMEAHFPRVLSTGTRAFSIDVLLKYQGHPQHNMPVTLFMTPHTTTQNRPQTLAVPAIPPASSDASPVVRSPNQQPLMTLYTHRQGNVRFVWQGTPLQGPAQIPIAVSFPGNSYFLPQQIQSVLVISPEQQGSSTYLWLGLGFLGLVIFLGTTGLHKIRSWWLQREKPTTPPPWPETPPPLDTGSISWASDPEILPGAQDDLSIVGVVLAVGTQNPLAGISVVVSALPDHPAEPSESMLPPEQTVTDKRGYFLITVTSPRRVNISFSHPHVQTKQMELTLPHRSHNKILRVTLASYRHLVYETFVSLARSSWYQKPFDPKSQTVREWLRSLPTEQAEMFEPLANAFEKAYYGSIMPTAQDYETLSTFFQTRIQKQR